MDIKKGKYYRFDGPNGFTVKALDNSYDATFRAVVVLQGDYTHKVGHISSAWSNTSFVESDLSEFLEEANKRYPIFSHYNCVGGDPEGKGGEGCVSEVEYQAKLWYYNDELRGVDMGNYVVYNFCIDKWAEPIIETDESRVSVFVENDLFNMDTNEDRLAYASKHYPIGTKYIPIDCDGKLMYNKYNSSYAPRLWDVSDNDDIEVGSGLIYHHLTNQWAEIIEEVKQEEKVMETQKLSRQGLKEIHGVACPNWKDVLAHYGSRNPLENYIELTQDEVDKMFKDCTKDQLPIVSKYLKKDDGSVDVSKMRFKNNGVRSDNDDLITIRTVGEYKDKAFYLTSFYNWEIKTDSLGKLCLIPTKKK